MATTRVSSGTVTVDGLRELSKALKDLGPEFQRELKDTNREVANTEADHARANALTVGGVAAKSAPSIKASAGITSAGVAFGGGAYPFAAGAEFGGRGRPTTQQFQPWRGSGSGAGYFVYPAIRADADRIEADYVAAVDKVIKRNFPY